jgi:hypothetical protein
LKTPVASSGKNKMKLVKFFLVHGACEVVFKFHGCHCFINNVVNWQLMTTCSV